MPAAKDKVPGIRNPQTWPMPIRNTLDWIVAQLHFAHAILRERLLDSGLSFFRDFVALLDRSIQDRTVAEEHALLHARSVPLRIHISNHPPTEEPEQHSKPLPALNLAGRSDNPVPNPPWV